MIHVDPNPEVFPFAIPFLGRPLLWYGVLFAFGFLWGYAILVRLLRQRPYREKKARYIAEKLAFYIVIGIVLGARLFDLLFYQNFSEIQKDPLSIFKVWEGGLASHGGVLGAFLAALLFLKRYKKESPHLSWRMLLDWMAIPAGVVACLIRIGNFMNQEILGIPTRVAWAFVFEHPLDHSPVLPRHPVQLYEALGYFILFILFYTYFRKKHWKEGKLAGLFLVLLFSFRFCIEFLKEKQSYWIDSSAYLDMGQILSLPLILFGLYLFFFPRK